jgi:hypothetical protein
VSWPSLSINFNIQKYYVKAFLFIHSHLMMMKQQTTSLANGYQGELFLADGRNLLSGI